MKSATGMLARIRHNIPSENYKSLYYSLFESHLSYCISVFGGVAKTHTEKLFRVQNHCIRILFGDQKAYLDKRNAIDQAKKDGKKLASHFYCKENTKPLFKKHKILAFANIYNYRTCIEILKIIQFRQPVSLLSLFKQSPRDSFLIPPIPSNQISYRGAKILNSAVTILTKNGYLGIINISQFKKKLKVCLFDIQNKYDKIAWYDANFDIETAIRTRIEQQNTNQKEFVYL